MTLIINNIKNYNSALCDGPVVSGEWRSADMPVIGAVRRRRSRPCRDCPPRCGAQSAGEADRSLWPRSAAGR